MNKLKICILAFALSFSSLSIFSQPVKEVYEEWPAKDISRLTIDNKFGTIYIEKTNDKLIRIEASFDIENLSKSNAEYLARQVRFNFDKSGHTVSSKTSFTNDFKTSQNFEIILKVKMPDNIELIVENSYGDVYMPDFAGKTNLTIEYGNLEAGKLTCDSSPVKLSLKYGKAILNEAHNLDADINYAELRVKKTGETNLNSKYSIIEINTTSQIELESNFDHVGIETVDFIKSTSNYSHFAINRINNSLELIMKHGDYKVQNVSKTIQTIEIDNTYGELFLNMPENLTYYLDSETYYTDLKYPDGTIIAQKVTGDLIKSSTKIGDGDSDSKITVKSRFGIVHLTK